MKKIIVALFLSLITVNASAQQAPKLSFQVAFKLAQRENSTQNIALLVKGNPSIVRNITEANGGTFKYCCNDISSIMLPFKAIRTLAENTDVKRIEEGAPRLQILSDTMRVRNNIAEVHAGLPPLPQPYDGEDVVVGIIDMGIHYQHADFKDSVGNTRIKFIWDHLLANGPNTPTPYNYGQEFTESDINNGLAAAHGDQGVHGTAITGIAAGNGKAQNRFTGAAPKADLIIVSVNFNQSDDQFLSSVADGVDYIYSKAALLGKPCVINISAGTYYGSHDGGDLQAQLIDNLITAQNGRSLVCAAGNLGTYPVHTNLQVTGTDTSFLWFRDFAGQVYCEFWGDTADMNNLTWNIVADKYTPGYEFRGELPFTNVQQQLGVMHEDTLFSLDGNRLGIVMSYADLVGDHYGMFYYIVDDSACYWRVQTTGVGEVDGYTFGWVISAPSSAVYPPVVNRAVPDLTQNMCSSFQCSDKTITVAQYVNASSYVDYNSNTQNFATTTNALHPTSSKGPTRDGRQKPDIAASGEWTFGSLNLFQQNYFVTTEPHKLAPGGMHLRANGTSAASAVVSGIAALYLQKYPFATWQDVKNAIINCKKTDSFTGTNLPDINWGHGKVNAFDALTNCGIVGIEESKDHESFQLYPNPAYSSINIELPTVEREVDLSFINSLGETVEHKFISGNQNYATVEISKLPKGFYTVVLKSKDSVRAAKMILATGTGNGY